MIENQQFITQAGKQKLEQELAELEGPRRQEISRRLKSAIEMGDLSENADYISAKEDQGFLEGRIQEIKAILKNSIVVDENNTNTHEVQIGNKVILQEDDYPIEVYELVGANEADPTSGKISYESPLGSALLGKHKGDIVTVSAPGGTLRFKIVKIE
ncbi:MAG TPA: transcription elongation factor GreA [Anaerolineaceae bacterium]|nr:MAG: Transcription elongation factor GreA [Anaerolineae bacterium 49_20]HAE86302.1 transcription elongation factor GreA [Anaerolineaceae bacterium]